MAKRKVNKTEAVREYVKNHPTATGGEIAAALAKQRIKITANYAANIKTTINKGRTGKKAKKQQAAVEVAAPAAVETPTKANNMVSLEHVAAVALTIKALGGVARLNDLLSLIKEVGGMKKFKDLVEAISVPEPNVITF